MANPANATLGEAPGRSARSLALVSPPPIHGLGPGQRARALFAEARAMSVDHLAAIAEEIAVLRGLLDAVTDAGDLYVPGVREFSSRLSEDLFWRSKTLEMLTQRQATIRERQ